MSRELSSKATRLFRRAEVADIARSLLTIIDPDPGRQGLRETPDRFALAVEEWFSGSTVEDPLAVLTLFDDGTPDNADEIILVSQIPFYSFCEHHCAPLFGQAYVGYLPNKRIVGLSKFKRFIDVFAKRLQVQERLTSQIADGLYEGLEPHGLGVVLHARHLCMEFRGINTPGTITTTSALRGAFKEAALRAEFFSLLPRLGDIRL